MQLNPLNALQELSIPQEVQKLIPVLLEKNLGLEDANALAHNTVFLFFSLQKRNYKQPIDILKSLSLTEIANLCSSHQEDEEYGYNISFKEE